MSIMIDYKAYPKIEEQVILNHSKLLKYGISIIFIFLMCLIFAASLIPYNNSFQTNIKITSTEPIVFVISNTNGFLTNITSDQGDVIQKDEVIGFIGNSSEYYSIRNLEIALKVDSLDKINTETIISSFESETITNPLLNNKYNEFIKSYCDFMILNHPERFQLFKANFIDKTVGTELNIKSKINELELSLQLDTNAKSRFERQNILFEKGVISKNQLEEFEQGYLETIKNTNTIKSEIQVLKSLLKSNVSDNRTLIQQYNENISKAYLNLKNSKNKLISSIENWKKKNLLVSPISGRVYFYDIDMNFRSTRAGDTIYSIVPKNHKNLIGKLKIPPAFSTKVKPNQKVKIELNNYPSYEWGQLRGHVNSISKTLNYQGKIGFATTINIDSTITSYGKPVIVSQDMLGSATIIMEETSILQRVFYRFKSLLVNDV